MEIAISDFKNWRIVEIKGKFVFKSLGQVEKAFNALEKSDAPRIAIDLQSTTHMDSSAITLLVKLFKRMKQKNGQVVFFGANSDITEIIDIVGLGSTLRFYKTRHEFEQNCCL
jgi:anti-sigma B factor antagonist